MKLSTTLVATFDLLVRKLRSFTQMTYNSSESRLQSLNK